MEHSRLTDVEITVMQLLSSALFQQEADVPDGVNWHAVVSECRQQAVTALAFSAVNAENLPPDLAQAFKGLADKAVADHMRIEWEHVLLNRLMNSAQIPYTTMKGCASAAYYPDPFVRTMGDVDFLIDKAYVEQADKILKANGFEVISAAHACETAYKRQSSVWELHWEPNGLPDGEAGRVAREYMRDVIESAQLCSTPEGDYKVPTAFHHGLIMLLHMSHHMVTSGVGLRHLCDWAVFVASMTDGEFEALFKEKLTKVGLFKYAQLMTLLAVRYLGCPERKWAGEAESELLEAMICDIFAGGNFGYKDPERNNEGKLITNRSKGGVDTDGGLIRQMTASMNEIVRLHFPIARKSKVFLPLGWIYVGGRHLIRIARGKKATINPKKMFEGAAARREIYSRFDLFKIGENEGKS